VRWRRVGQFKERGKDKGLIQEKGGRNQKSVLEQVSLSPLISKGGIGRLAMAAENVYNLSD
jgi:hypothetical protein